MSVLESIIGVFAPHTCLGCGAEENKLLCAQCRDGLVPVPPRCYRCRAATAGYRVCSDCATATPLCQVLVATRYRGAAKDLVCRLKFDRAQSGAREIASLLADKAGHFPADAVLVHVPTASGRVRMRGYDHARLVARSLSRQTGNRHMALLGRIGQARQVGASRADRLQQLQHAFRPVRPDAIRGRHIVLVDDVLTTGATLEAAARALQLAGAASVSAIVFAQA